MKKTAVIYWSGTGNTKQMAEAVLEGMKNAGAEAVLLEPAQVDASTFSGVDAVAFGCGCRLPVRWTSLPRCRRKSPALPARTDA